MYYIDDRLDKRKGTHIFGACCATTVFIPRNYCLDHAQIDKLNPTVNNTPHSSLYFMNSRLRVIHRTGTSRYVLVYLGMVQAIISRYPFAPQLPDMVLPGLAMTTYTACYLTIAALIHGQASHPFILVMIAGPFSSACFPGARRLSVSGG